MKKSLEEQNERTGISAYGNAFLPLGKDCSVAAFLPAPSSNGEAEKKKGGGGWRSEQSLHNRESPGAWSCLGGSEGRQMNEAVGITEFVHPELAGLRGIIKARFSDFVVREVDLSGRVTFLSDITDNGLEARHFGAAEATPTESDGAEAANPLEALLTDLQALSAALVQDMSPSEREDLASFITACQSKDEEGPSEWTGFPCADKAIRSAVHQAIKARLASWVENITVQADGKSLIKLIAKHRIKGGGKGGSNDGRDAKRRRIQEWPKDCGDFLEFTLLKENVDTMSAVQIITKHLKLKPDAIAYNGTKDKRGVTTQRCTIYRRKPSHFSKINSYPHTPTLRIGDFRYVSQPAKLGALAGNRFEIVLRDLQAKDAEHVRQSCSALQQDGFINYFGLQRFGKGGAPSHRIGIEILKSNWKACLDLLFAPRTNPKDKEDIIQAKEKYFAGDYTAACQLLPQAMSAEKAVLKKLQQAPEDAMNAYHAVSKNMRLLCVHALQSYVWNLAASHRVREGGRRVVEGDVVLVRRQGGGVGVGVSGGGGGEGGEEEEDEGYCPQEWEAHLVTAEEIEKQVFSLQDVVLPLIGSTSLLPSHGTGQYIQHLLQEVGLQPSSFFSCAPVYRCRGSYRRIWQWPGDMTWKTAPYTHPAQEILETEVSRFRETAAVKDTAEAEQSPRQALVLGFTLAPGTYATMLLREITKESTETDYHAQLSHADEKGLPTVVQEE